MKDFDGVVLLLLSYYLGGELGSCCGCRVFSTRVIVVAINRGLLLNMIANLSPSTLPSLSLDAEDPRESAPRISPGKTSSLR